MTSNGFVTTVKQKPDKQAAINYKGNPSSATPLSTTNCLHWSQVDIIAAFATAARITLAYNPL